MVAVKVCLHSLRTSKCFARDPPPHSLRSIRSERFDRFAFDVPLLGGTLQGRKGVPVMVDFGLIVAENQKGIGFGEGEFMRQRAVAGHEGLPGKLKLRMHHRACRIVACAVMAPHALNPGVGNTLV